MPKLPVIKPRDIERVLLKKGFMPRTTKSSHIVFTHQDGRRTKGKSRVWISDIRIR